MAWGYPLLPLFFLRGHTVVGRTFENLHERHAVAFQAEDFNPPEYRSRPAVPLWGYCADDAIDLPFMNGSPRRKRDIHAVIPPGGMDDLI